MMNLFITFCTLFITPENPTWRSLIQNSSSTLQKQYWVAKPNIAKQTLGYNPTLQKQYWVVKPNVAKATLGYNPTLQKQYWVLKPNVAKETLGYNPTLKRQHWDTTQCCKSNIGLQPNVSKATLGYNTQHCNCKSNIELQTQRCKEKLICYNPMLLCRATQC